MIFLVWPVLTRRNAIDPERRPNRTWRADPQLSNWAPRGKFPNSRQAYHAPVSAPVGDGRRRAEGVLIGSKKFGASAARTVANARLDTPMLEVEDHRGGQVLFGSRSCDAVEL
jgi:hypothetical protein